MRRQSAAATALWLGSTHPTFSGRQPKRWPTTSDGSAGRLPYFFYDNAGRTTNAVYPDGYAVTNRYNLLGQLTNVIDSAGTSVTNWFNNQGLLVTSSNAFGRISAAIYDVLDRATNSVDANSVTITNAFDNLNRLLTCGYPDGGVEKYGYTLNVAGVTSYTNQLGSNVVNYAYDALGRKTNEVYPGITTNKYAYIGSDLLTLTDGKNQTTTWHYDEYGRTTNKVDAASTEIFRFAYDPNGLLTNRWTAAKGTTIYRYDVVGNLTNVDYAVSPDITLQYDSLNRLTNMVDAVGTNRYTYDAASQLLSEDGPWASDTATYTYTNRLRRSLSLQQPSGSWTNGYAYDVVKRLTNITSQAGSFGYAYDPARSALINKLSLPGGAYITNRYDGNTRLLGTALRNSGGTILNSHDYAYNAGNQRTQQVFSATNYLNYSYDNIGQLKTASGYEAGATPRVNEKFGYTYDAAGNLNYRTNNALTQTFNVNSLNELTTVGRNGTLTVAGTTTSTATNVTVNSLSAARYSDKTFAKEGFPLVDGTTNFTAIAQDSYGRQDTNAVAVDLRATNTFAYDLNGNLRTNGTQILEFDDENQLVTNRVTSAWKSEFVYDGVNRRRIQRDYAWSGGAWVKTNETRFIYDGNLVIQHRDTNNQPTLTLTRGLDLSGSFQRAGGIGGLLSMTESSGAQGYYHADGNGNVTGIINQNQLVVGRYAYDPFGTTLSISGPKAFINPYRFSSKPVHELSGNYDFFYRWYEPNLQRWLNRDPIGEWGGINLYGFVGNGPVNSVDLYGLLEPDVNRGGGSFTLGSNHPPLTMTATIQQNPPNIFNQPLTFQNGNGRQITVPALPPTFSANSNPTAGNSDPLFAPDPIAVALMQILASLPFPLGEEAGLASLGKAAKCASAAKGAASSRGWIFGAGTSDAMIDKATADAIATLDRYGAELRFSSVPSRFDTATSTRLGWTSWGPKQVTLFPGHDVTTLIEEAHHVETAAQMGYLGERAATAAQDALWGRNLEAAWEAYAKSIGLVPK